MKKLLCFLLIPLSLFGCEPKVYDCFMINNELEVLEIRFHTLYNYVDKFVLVESRISHLKGELKPFYFDENKARFAPFLDKVIHVKLYELEGKTGWERENWNRNQIMRGLSQCQPEDIIFISDSDEFIPGELVLKIKSEIDQIERVQFMHQWYRWYLNRHLGQWPGLSVIRYKELKWLTPQGVRNLGSMGVFPRWEGGWHFSTMGGFNRVTEKFQQGVEGGYIDAFLWSRYVDSATLVPIDESYPKFVQENIEYLTSEDLIDPVSS